MISRAWDGFGIMGCTESRPHGDPHDPLILGECECAMLKRIGEVGEVGMLDDRKKAIRILLWGASGRDVHSFKRCTENGCLLSCANGLKCGDHLGMIRVRRGGEVTAQRHATGASSRHCLKQAGYEPWPCLKACASDRSG